MPCLFMLCDGDVPLQVVVVVHDDDDEPVDRESYQWGGREPGTCIILSDLSHYYSMSYYVSLFS